MQRRQLLAVGAGLLTLDAAFAQAARTGFNTEGLAATLQALGLAAPQPSRELLLDAPDIAENGALVKVALSCKLPSVKKFWLLAERNPNALILALDWSDLLEPRLVTQIKLAQSGWVYGVAQLTDNKLLLAQKDVKVTLGGCAA
jgi:sulfur-oxidizing protein SoxY